MSACRELIRALSIAATNRKRRRTRTIIQPGTSLIIRDLVNPRRLVLGLGYLHSPVSSQSRLSALPSRTLTNCLSFTLANCTYTDQLHTHQLDTRQLHTQLHTHVKLHGRIMVADKLKGKSRMLFCRSHKSKRVLDKPVRSMARIKIIYNL